MNDGFRLDNQIAVVTGACGKLGPIWVEALLDAGARVAALELPGAPASAAFKDLADRCGDQVQRFDCDITSRVSIEGAAESLVREMGEPAVLVNNAGVDQPPETGGTRSKIDALPIDQFRRMVEVNLLGTFQVTQVIGGRMAARGGGSIINIGSVHSVQNVGGTAPYAASKGGVAALTREAAIDLAPAGIRVNAICPGWVDTPLIRGIFESDADPAEARRAVERRQLLGRLGRPEEIGRAAVFLAGDDSSYMTGSLLFVDSGMTAQLETWSE